MTFSERERAILRHLARGRTNQQIAADLHFTQAVLAQHLTRVYEKIGVELRSQAVDWARRNGFD